MKVKLQKDNKIIERNLEDYEKNVDMFTIRGYSLVEDKPKEEKPKKTRKKKD